MKALRRQIRLLAELVVDPRRALHDLGTSPPLVGVLLVLGLLQAGCSLAQSLLVEPALRADFLAGDGLDAGPSWRTVLWVARLSMFLVGPAAMALRGAGLSTLLQAGALGCGQSLPWRPLLSLVLHLDVVFWVENVAATLLVAIACPTSLDAIQALHLRAGLDLLWQPREPAIGRLLAAANLFSIWWAILLGLGLVAVVRLSRRSAPFLAGTAWVGLVVVRFLVDRR